MKEYTKIRRQAEIREILSGRPAVDQIAIGRELLARGIQAAQATISRDLREMGLTKARQLGGQYAYAAEPSGTVSREEVEKQLKVMFVNFVRGVKDTSHLVLVKTAPGYANGLASLLDALEDPGILGTIAGDDTVLVVVEKPALRAGLARHFRALLQGS